MKEKKLYNIKTNILFCAEIVMENWKFDQKYVEKWRK